MGFGNSKKKEIEVPTPPDKNELKTIFQICSNKLTLFRNKKINSLKIKKNEIIQDLKEENLDFAKSRLISYISDEDYITACDILGPFLEILEERIIYIDSSNECPADLRKQLDSVIYASIRLEIEDFLKLKDTIKRKYGENYITKAEKNVDKFIDEFLIDKLQVKLYPESLINIRLKQICNENNIKFNFPMEENVPGELVQSIGGFNPYGSLNPYGQPSNMNNNQPENNNLPPKDDGNPYSSQPKDPYDSFSGNNKSLNKDNLQFPTEENNNNPHESSNNPSNQFPSQNDSGQFPETEEKNKNPFESTNNAFISQNEEIKSSSGSKFNDEKNQNNNNSSQCFNSNNVNLSEIDLKNSKQNINNSLENQSNENKKSINDSIKNSNNFRITGKFLEKSQTSAENNNNIENSNNENNNNVENSNNENNNNVENSNNENNDINKEYEKKKTKNPFEINRDYTHDEDRPIQKGESKSINVNIFKNESIFNPVENKSQIEEPKVENKSMNPKIPNLDDYNPKEDV